jgi:uroporphyrinogen decarboxylase
MTMTSRMRMLAAIEGKMPDRLPVTTHHVMPYFLKKHMNNISIQEFFDFFGFDAILWSSNHMADETKGQYCDPGQVNLDFLESRRIVTDNWRIESEELPDSRFKTTWYRIVTPKGTLTMTLQSNEYTTWIIEHPVKEKRDIDIIAEYAPIPKCDVETVNKAADAFGDRGIVRTHLLTFDLFGQPGCWQDACCIVGSEKMIMESFDDPEWVHELLRILLKRKVGFVQTMKGARYDILELGGGDGSTTVISPKIFNEFVAPYDSQIIKAAHDAGQRIAYHLCGGKMPILEDIAAMKPDAVETFTPPGMGGDSDLAEAKRRIGDKICMIGGFDQFHFLQGCRPEETRAAVRRCFEQAGGNGRYIISPSDHFFDADPNLIRAFVEEVHRCTY